MIDRPIRPLFPEGFRNEVQIVATVLSYDNENDPDIVAMVGCSAALTLSGIPFFGPIAAARVGFENGAFILNPTAEQMKTSQLELVLAGTAEGVLMVESEAQELSEEIMLGAVKFGHDGFQPVINAIIELAEHAAKEPWPLPEKSDEEKALAARVDALGRAGIAEAYQEKVKQARYEKVAAAKKAAAAALTAEGMDADKAKGLFHDLEADVVRNAILDTGIRIDGRDTRTVRPKHGVEDGKRDDDREPAPGSAEELLGTVRAQEVAQIPDRGARDQGPVAICQMATRTTKMGAHHQTFRPRGRSSDPAAAAATGPGARATTGDLRVSRLTRITVSTNCQMSPAVRQIRSASARGSRPPS